MARARPASRTARARDDSLEEFFSRLPALLGRDATPSEQAAFERYADLLLLWNRTHHLTAVRTRAAVGTGLFLDSLLFKALFPPSPLRVADVGAGAGIPGLPIRIVDPAVRVTLIESRRKPISFLHALTRELRLEDVDVQHGRVEELIERVDALRGEFDLVLTRSVRLDPSFMRSAMRLLKPGGKLVASGPPTDKATPKVEWGGKTEWKTIRFGALGVVRRFFAAIQEA